MTTASTYKADIYLGLRRGYGEDAPVVPLDEVKAVVQAYCECGLGVTLTQTEFIYTGGSEPGVIVGLINYPRYPMEPAEIRTHAIRLAEQLKELCEQWRVTIVFPGDTMLLGPLEGGRDIKSTPDEKLGEGLQCEGRQEPSGG
jgi:hypothetical protein